MQEQEPLRIEIPIEEEEETIYQTEADSAPVTRRLAGAGRSALERAQEAWQSEARQTATARLQQGVQTAASRSGQAIQQAAASAAVQRTRAQLASAPERIARSNFKTKTRRCLANGAGWLSVRLERLAVKLTPEKGNGTPD